MTGFKTASDSAQKLKVDTSDLSDETKRQLGILEPLDEEIKKGGQAAQEANHHHNNSRMLYTEMNKIIPGLGHAMHAMHAGAVAPAIAFLMALDGVVKLLEDEKKKAEEAATANADIFTAGWEANAGAISKVRELSEEFNRAVNESGQTVLKLLDEQQSKEASVLSAKIEGEKKIRAARMESEILAAGDDKTKISGIRDRYKIADEVSGLADEGKRIELLEKYKAANQQLAGSFKAQAGSAEKNLEDFTGQPYNNAANEEKKNQLESKIKAGSKDFRDETDIFQTAKMFEEYRRMAIEHPDDKMAVAGYNSLKEKGEKADELWKQMEEYKALTKEISDHAAELKRLQDQVRDTEAKFKEASNAVDRLTAQIDSARAVQQQHQETDKTLIPLETRNAAARETNEKIDGLKNTPAGKEEFQAEKIADMVRNHQQVSQSQLEFIAKAYADVTGHQAQSWGQILALFNRAANNQEALLAQIQAIDRRLTQVSQQVQHSVYNSH